MTGIVIPFPYTARRDGLPLRIAARAAQFHPAKGEAHVQRQLAIQAETMRRRGVTPEIIDREIRSLERMVRAAQRALLDQGGVAGVSKRKGSRHANSNRNAISGPFVARSSEMLNSPAWGALTGNDHLILSRLEREHVNHGGAENGNLTCTYDDLQEAGVPRRYIRERLAVLEALGFIKVARFGYVAAGGSRPANQYTITYLNGVDKPTAGGIKAAPLRTDDWKRHQDDDAVERVIAHALNALQQERPNAKRTKRGNSFPPSPDHHPGQNIESSATPHTDRSSATPHTNRAVPSSVTPDTVSVSGVTPGNISEPHEDTGSEASRAA